MATPPKPWRAEYAKSGRGLQVPPVDRDRLCLGKIVQSSNFDGFMPVRVSTRPEGQGARGVAWHHIHCFIQMSPSIDIQKVSLWDNLPSEEKAAISSLVKKKETSTTQKAKEDKLSASVKTYKGSKRKK